MTPRQFMIDKPERVQAFTGWLGKQELPLDVTVAPYRKERSTPANNRLWLLHGKAAEVAGDSPQGMHDDCCCDYFGYTEVKMPSGYMKRKPKRTTTKNEQGERDVLKGDPFNKFMTWVEQRYIDMLGIWLD